MNRKLALLSGIALSLSSLLQAEEVASDTLDYFFIDQQELQALGAHMTSIEVIAPSQLDSESLALLIDALTRKEPIEVVRTQSTWIINLGKTADDRVTSLSNTVQLLNILVRTHSAQASLARTSEDYADQLLILATNPQSEVFGIDQVAVADLLRLSRATLLGIHTRILQVNPDFEHFVVVNHIEKDMSYFGHHAVTNSYNIPMLPVQGVLATLPEIKKLVSVDSEDKMIGWVYTRNGGLVPVASSDHEEAARLRKQVDALQDELKRKDRTISDLERTSAEGLTYVNQLKSDIQTRDGRIAVLNDNVTALNKQVAQKDQALAAADQLSKNQTTKIADLTQQIKTKDSELERLTKVNGGKDRDIEKLLQTINAKDREIERLQQEVDRAKQSTSGKEGELEKLQQALSIKERESAKLVQVLYAKDQEITDLKAQVKELTNQLRDLTRQ